MVGDESETEGPNAKVSIVTLREDGSRDAEALWACDLGSGLYRLASLPLFAYDLSVDDVIAASFDKAGGNPTFDHVERKCGNRTVRVILLPFGGDDNPSKAFLACLSAIGCRIEGADRWYVAVNLPSEIPWEDVRTLLNASGYEWELSDPMDHSRTLHSRST